MRIDKLVLVGETLLVRENYNLAVSEDRLNKDNMLLVGENSYVSQTNFVCLPDPHPFSAFERFDCAPARRVAALRAECFA